MVTKYHKFVILVFILIVVSSCIKEKSTSPERRIVPEDNKVVVTIIESDVNSAAQKEKEKIPAAGDEEITPKDEYETIDEGYSEEKEEAPKKEENNISNISEQTPEITPPVNDTSEQIPDNTNEQIPDTTPSVSIKPPDAVMRQDGTIIPRGTVKILIFELIPPDFYDREEIECCYSNGCTSVDPSLYNPLHCSKYTMISFFNRRNGNDNMPSIYLLKEWYENQARLYNITDLNVEIEIAGPFVIDPRLEYGFKVETAVMPLFRDKLAEKGYSKNYYHFIHYVYFDDFSINPNTTTSGFRSFAYSGETFNDVSYGPPAIRTILHETGHMFGGDDLYVGSLCKIPEGIPFPERPLSSQGKACLMCGYIMTGETSTQAVNYINEELVLCDHTAKKFGWNI